jgi:uncharacterized membrane protein
MILTLLNESLWGDEAFSAMAVMKPFKEMMGVVMRDTAPPGFYVVGWLWGRIFGFSEVGLRLLSLFLILGASVFVGLLVAKLAKNRVLGWLASLLAFFSPFSFVFSFEWRMYALLAFLTMASIYFFVLRKWRAYVLVTVLALYTHHLALLTVAAQALWFLETEFSLVEKWDKKSLIRLIKHLWPFWLIGLLYLPWVYPMYLQTTRVQGAGFWLKAPSLKEILVLVLRFMLGGVAKGQRWLAGLIVAGLLVFKNWKKLGRRYLELAVIVFVPVLFSAIISYVVTPIFYDRYLLSVVLGIAALITLGTNKKLLPLLVLLVVIYALSSFQLFITPNKRPFREFAAVVKAQVQPGDYLVNYNGKAHHLWETKYYGIPAPIYLPKGELPLYVGTAQMSPDDIIKELPKTAKRIGLITSEDPEELHFGSVAWHLDKIVRVGEMSLIWYR